MPVRIALPKGRLLGETADLLRKAEWGLTGYSASERYYRLKSRRFPDLRAKVFHERDIPVQVAVGNYDLGICGLDWVEELLTGYPSSALIKLRGLDYGQNSLYMVAGQSQGVANEEELKARPEVVRIVSEYPNLAESFALRLRLKRFKVFPLWGAAEVYPPESADLALVPVKEPVSGNGLVPVSKVLQCSAWLIANARSWETKDMSEIVSSIPTTVVGDSASASDFVPLTSRQTVVRADEDTVRLALPDGHQQLPIRRLLDKAGIEISDYPSSSGNRRPAISLEGVTVKVIRPQDMPLQVANGNFDLAITGKDWLRDHLCQFPSSPVAELIDLKSGKVRIVAVVSGDLPVADAVGLRQYCLERSLSLRVASEYVNIADRYAQDNHLGMYRVIPTWGATEAFVPEDADLLIENTETGRTLERHGLKIIDTILESTACLIGNTSGSSSAVKMERLKFIIGTLRRAVEAS